MHLHFGLKTVSFDCKRLDYTSVFQKVQPGFSGENLLRRFPVFLHAGVCEWQGLRGQSKAELSLC